MESAGDLILPDLPDLLAARRALAGVVLRTPVLRSDILDELAGARLFFKAEGLQVTGSFKVRGAYNRIRSFSPEEMARGLITVSAGNAALGAAWAARAAGARLVVVMPENAVPEKLAAVAAMGGQIEKEGITNATQAFERLARLREEHGYTLVHPFDDPLRHRRRRHATWELLEDVPDLDALAIPASGGGPLSGALLAARGLAPAAKVYGVQPAGADGIVRSLAAGVPTPPEKVQTVADGLTAPKPGVHNFEMIRRWATDVFTVPDAAILAAMGLILRHLRVIVEPAGAAALAGVLADERFRGRRVGHSADRQQYGGGAGARGAGGGKTRDVKDDKDIKDKKETAETVASPCPLSLLSLLSFTSLVLLLPYPSPRSRAKTSRPLAGITIRAEVGHPSSGGPSAVMPQGLPAVCGLYPPSGGRLS